MHKLANTGTRERHMNRAGPNGSCSAVHNNDKHVITLNTNNGEKRTNCLLMLALTMKVTGAGHSGRFGEDQAGTSGHSPTHTINY